MNRFPTASAGLGAIAKISTVIAVGVAACAVDPVTGSLAQPATAVVANPPQDVPMSNEYIPGLRAPRPGVLTSGQPEPAAWPRLAADGVQAVINLRPDAELAGRNAAAEVAAAGLDYTQIPVAGAADVTVENATELWQAMRAVDGPVLVHCASGNRVGALMALAAVKHEGVAPDDALAFGRAAGLTSLEPRVRELLGLPAVE